jgi:capsular polysaccharide biosynthesis protein
VVRERRLSAGLLGVLIRALRLLGASDVGRAARVSIRGEAGAVRRGELAPARPTVVQPPQRVGAPPPDPVTVDLPALEWLLLADVIVSGSTLVMQRGHVLAGPDLDRVITRGGQVKGPGIRWHRNRTALVDAPRPRRRVPRGVDLTGFGANNWYHWLIEILPRLGLLERVPADLRGLPLIVPSSATSGTASEILRVLCDGRELIPVGRDETLRVDELLWIDSPVLGVRTFRRGAEPSVTDSLPHLPTLRAHREHLLGLIGLSSAAQRPGERLLLLRGRAEGLERDPSIMAAIARRFDLRPVDLGALPFAEQARLLATADVVVGAWGAAWAGWILTPRTARGLIWAPETFAAWPLYSNLTSVGGRELQHLFLPSRAADFRASNRDRPHPSPEQLAEALERFEAAARVPAD